MARCGRLYSIPHHLDTLTLARRAFGLRSNRLGALAASLGIKQDRAHRAGDDVGVMRAIFDRIVAELKPTTPRDLWHVRVGERHARPEVLAACHTAVGKAPVVVHYRPSGRAAEQFAFVVTAIRTDLDPPRVIGYLVPGRGHRDLRSDRILAVEPFGSSIDGLAPGNT
jgi:DNA polymerase-3 subunit epsilon